MSHHPRGDTPPSPDVLRKIWHSAREATQKRQQVVQAVRAARQGMTREQLRDLFEEELARREMPADPMWVEHRLDELEWSAGERMRHRAEGAVLAVEFVGRLRHRVVQKREAPKWME